MDPMKIGIVILFVPWCCQNVNCRKSFTVKDSIEDVSYEDPVPFSAEFGDFFDRGLKDSLESVSFRKKIDRDFPFAESRNISRYTNPSSSFYSIKHTPGRYRSVYREDEPRSYRKEEIPYRKGESSSYRKDGPLYYKQRSSYRKSEPYYSKDDLPYRKDDAPYKRDNPGYRKSAPSRHVSSSYDKEDKSYIRDEGRYRSKQPYYRDDGALYRRDPSRGIYQEKYYSLAHPSYRSNDPKLRMEDPPYKKEPPHRKENLESEEKNYKKKTVHNLYDDWTPEDERPTYHSRHANRELDDRNESQEDPREYDEETGPDDYKDRTSQRNLPASDRPGPPYQGPQVHRKEPKTYSSLDATHHSHRSAKPNSYYASSRGRSRAHNPESSEFHRRLGEVLDDVKTHEGQEAQSEFRPSPPDPLMNNRLMKLEKRDYLPQTDSRNPKPKKTKVNNTAPYNQKSCVKIKKAAPAGTSLGAYVTGVMTCYLCADKGTGENYEQCSYESKSNEKPAYLSSENKNLATDSIRREKREIFKYERSKRETDYYDSSEHQYERKNKGYRYVPESHEDDGSGPESSGEYGSEEDECYRTIKGDMSCIVCETPNKKGSYERCSYAIEPKPKTYEHSVEKVYGSPRLPTSRSQTVFGRPYLQESRSYSDSTLEEEYDTDGMPYEGMEKKSTNRKSDFPFPSLGGFEFPPELFPDMSSEVFNFDSIPEPAQLKKHFSSKGKNFDLNFDDMKGINIPKNIDDFDTKNRSECKKVMKNKMTCYQCVNSNGTKQEECMYVEASEPDSKRLSFSQVEEYSSDPKRFKENERTKYLNRTETKVDDPTLNWGKRKFKKYHPDLSNVKYYNRLKEKATLEASRWPRSPQNITHLKDDIKNIKKVTINRIKNNKKITEKDKINEDDNTGDEDDDVTEENVEDDVSGEENKKSEEKVKEIEKGEYAYDTESVWDPELKMSLPRYMLERTEHETAFDEVLNSG